MPDELALLIADVYEAAGALRRSGERLAATEGQTQARWQVLSVLSGAPLTVPAAARRLGISRQAVQRTAGELVADGLAQFVANPDHRTAGLLQLTDDGRHVLS
nr:helix-turn-helix domain-containing protein [Micromonospora sp. DSM 115978]